MITIKETDAEVKKETYDGVESLYTPDKGSVVYRFNVPKAAKYGVAIEYYPVEGKATSIQRTFLINGKVPLLGGVLHNLLEGMDHGIR